LIETIPLKQTSLLSVVIAAMIATPVLALDVLPYQADAFSRARSEGKVTAIQFHSGWCPVCVMQERGVKALMNDKSMGGVIVFQADYFKEEALRRRFDVSSFSTLVVFRGELERARTTGDFRPEQLKQLFAKAL
jgi:thioredoxin 1